MKRGNLFRNEEKEESRSGGGEARQREIDVAIEVGPSKDLAFQLLYPEGSKALFWLNTSSFLIFNR